MTEKKIRVLIVDDSALVRQTLSQVLSTDPLIEVIATDAGAVKDFAAWSTSTGNTMVESDSANGKFRFVLRHK